jgi:hypothetical protein
VILRELFTKLGLDVDAQSFAKGQLAVEGIKLGLSKLAELGKTAVRSIVELATETAAYGDVTIKTAQQLGLTAEQYQQLDFAMQRSGTSIEQQRGSMTRFARTARDATKGVKIAEEAFERLGISVRDAGGEFKDPHQLLLETATAFQELPDGIEKTALGMDIFGRSGTQLIQFLNLGEEGLRAMSAEADRLGLVMSTEAARGAERFVDTQLDLRMAIVGIKRELGVAFMPLIRDMLESTKEWIVENRKFIRLAMHKVLAPIIKAGLLFLKVLGALGDAMLFLHRNAKLVAFIFSVGAFVVAMNTAAGAISLLTLAQVKAGAVAVVMAAKTAAAWALAAAPFAAIGVALGALFLVFDDLRVHARGGKSLFGLWEDWFKEWWTTDRDDPWWLKAIKGLTWALQDLLAGGGLADQFESWIETVSAFFGSETARQLKVRRAAARVSGPGGTTYLDRPTMSLPPTTRGMVLPPGAGAHGMQSIAPQFSAEIYVTAPEGASAQSVAEEVKFKINDFWNTKMEEVKAASGE